MRELSQKLVDLDEESAMLEKALKRSKRRCKKRDW